MSMASAHAARPAVPSEPWVSAVPALKNLGSCAAVVASQSLTCLGFVSTQHMNRLDGGLFPGSLLHFSQTFEGSTQHRDTGYFCFLAVREGLFFHCPWGACGWFLFASRGQITQQMTCTVSPFLSSHHQFILGTLGGIL